MFERLVFHWVYWKSFSSLYQRSDLFIGSFIEEHCGSRDTGI